MAIGRLGIGLAVAKDGHNDRQLLGSLQKVPGTKEEIAMAAHASLQGASAILRNRSKVLPDLEALYKDIHAHPELSMHETRTAGIAADRLRKAVTR